MADLSCGVEGLEESFDKFAPRVEKGFVVAWVCRARGEGRRERRARRAWDCIVFCSFVEKRGVGMFRRGLLVRVWWGL